MYYPPKLVGQPITVTFIKILTFYTMEMSGMAFNYLSSSFLNLLACQLYLSAMKTSSIPFLDLYLDIVWMGL